MTARNLSLGATHQRLHDNGYAATSASSPDRVSNRFSSGHRDSFFVLANDPAAIMLYPRHSNGASEALDDLEQREVVALWVTAYALADARQAKALAAVFADYGIDRAPTRRDSFGNEVRLLRWNGSAIFDGDFEARLCFDSDDRTVFIEHAIAPGRYATRTNGFGTPQRVAIEPVGSHVVLLDGEWRGGHPLDTPREKLPELLPADASRLIADIECARWGARPAAAARDAAA